MAQPIVVEKRAGVVPAYGVPLRAGLVLLLAVTAQSTGSPLLRLAQDDVVPVPVIVGLRLALATVILTPLAWSGYRAQLRALSCRDVGLAALAGVFLALHFLSFTASLGYTTVLVTMLFGRTDSLWTALLEAGLLRARIGRLVWIGMGITALGGAVIALGSGSGDLGAQPLLGGVLAGAGALFFACYAVLGRAVRPKVDNLPYVWLVYGSAAIVANLALLGSGLTPTGYSGRGSCGSSWWRSCPC
jgi:drug/metabolite transporter (DMT)-like permease